MNGKKLTKIFFTGFIALFACAILLPMVVSAGKLVERPFKVKSQGVLSFVTGESFDSGTAMQVGNFTNEALWIPDPDDESLLYGQGTVTAANGDKRFWIATNYMQSQPMPGEEFTAIGTAIFTGGTGRFENITGGFDFELKLILSEDGSYATFSYTGEGKVTY